MRAYVSIFFGQSILGMVYLQKRIIQGRYVVSRDYKKKPKRNEQSFELFNLVLLSRYYLDFSDGT
jgi:hypothetical protein